MSECALCGCPRAGRHEKDEATQLRELVGELAVTLDVWADAKEDDHLVELLDRARRAAKGEA